MKNYEKYLIEMTENKDIIYKPFTIQDIIYSSHAIWNKIDNRITETTKNNKIITIDQIYNNIKIVAPIFNEIMVMCLADKLSWYRSEKLNFLLNENNSCNNQLGFAIDFTTNLIDEDFEMLCIELSKFTRLILQTSKSKKRIHLEFDGNNEKIFFKQNI